MTNEPTLEQKRNMDLCEGYKLSNCCDAPIIMGDICSDCREYTDIQCIDCIFNNLCDNAEV